MGCGCSEDKLALIDPCDMATTLDVLLQMTCCACRWQVPEGISEGDFLTLAPDGVGDCDLYVVEVINEYGTPTSLFVGNGIQWGQVAGTAVQCVVTVPTGTVPSAFIATGWGGTAPSACEILFVVYADNSEFFVSTDNGSTWIRLTISASSTSFTLPSDYTLLGSADSGWLYTDVTNLKHQFTVHGSTPRHVLLTATATVSGSNAYTASTAYSFARFGLNVGSGVLGGGSGGYTAPNFSNNSGYSDNTMRIWHVVELSAGTHTAFLQWRLDANTAGSMTIYAADPVEFTAIILPV